MLKRREYALRKDGRTGGIFAEVFLTSIGSPIVQKKIKVKVKETGYFYENSK